MNAPADKVNRAATVSRQPRRAGLFSRSSEDPGTFFRPARPFIQPRLEVSKPDDPQEREAEQTAERVMAMPEPVLGPPPAPAAPASPAIPSAPLDLAQRAERPEEDLELQTQAEPVGPSRYPDGAASEEPHLPTVAPAATPAFGQPLIHRRVSPAPGGSGPSCHRRCQRACGSVYHSDVVQRAGRGPPIQPDTFETHLSQTRGTGRELPADTRSFMESRFQADFGGVRIHTGAAAQSLSKTIHAQAFTHGGDIYFNSGKYDPGSAAGRSLLAHELTHTIQQGASRPLLPSMPSSASPPAVAARGFAPVTCSPRSLQRQAAVPQLTAAVNHAKGEEGKVNANLPGPDGFRTGWERLLDYFRTSMGPDKIVSGSGAYVAGTVSERVIKTKSKAMGQVANQPPDVQALRDAMPSWCGIFVFWALNKGGVPMPKWVLGGPAIRPEAAYPPGHRPVTGDIAYRNDHSHYAIVDHATGSGRDAEVTTVNGNTAGEDNLGGQIQTRAHKLSGWTAFFNPLVLMQGSLRDVEDPSAQPKSLRELRRELFRVSRMTENADAPAVEPEETVVQPRAESGPAAATDGAVPPAHPSRTVDRAAEPSSAEEEREETDEPAVVQRRVQRQWDGDACAARAQAVAGPAPGAVERLQPSPALSSVSPARAGAATAGALSAGWYSARGPPRVAASPGDRVQCSWLSDAWNAVSGFASEAAQWIEEGLDAAKRWLLRKVRDFVRAIPGYQMLSFILAEDPITGERVERTGRNLLYAGLDLLPGGGLFRRVMERIGAVDDLAAYLDARIADLSRLAAGISDRFSRFWDSLSLDDVGDPEGVFNRVADLLRSTVDGIVGFVTRAAVDFLAMIKRIMLREIVGFIRTRVPRLYPLLCVALGHDPVTGEEVARNGTNILHAILEVSEEGREQRRQMQETGTFQRIAGFIDRGIAVFTSAYHQFRAAFSNLWDLVTIDALVSPLETFNRIYEQFAAPVRLVTDYIVDVAREILRVIKEVLMARLSAYARTVRGYPLVTVIIGRDPFTGQAVPRSIENIIRGFMSLMDGGEEQFQQMKESGAIDRTTARIHAAVARLNLTPASIIQLFIDLWRSFSLRDLAHPIEAFRRIVATFGEPIGRLIAFVIEIVRIIVEVILQVMNFPVDLIGNIITRTREAFQLIKRDPVGFLKNLLRSIKQGFIQFFDRILTHLLNGVTGWLMSELRDAGVPTLSDFSLRGVIGWVLQVLGISMEKIWEKLAAHPRIGPERVARIRSMIDRLEGIWTFIKDVQERGMAAVWDKIQEQLSNLWDTVLDAVKNWIMERIVNAVVTRLLSMLDPTGIMAVINSAIAIYRAVQSFIRYITQMLQVVNSFVEGVVEIAQGSIARAANALEAALDRAMPIVIGFLANQVGLGGVGRRIGEMIERVREMVDRALTWLVNRAVDTGFALIDRALSLGRRAGEAVLSLLGIRKQFRAADGENHTMRFSGEGASAQLLIESTPTPLEHYIDGLRSRYTTPAARAKLAVIDTHIANVNREKQQTMGAARGETIRQNLEAIAAALADPAFGGNENLPPSYVAYTPATKLGGPVGGTMEAKPLSLNPGTNSLGGANVGSEPADAGSTNLWEKVRVRPQTYIQGHLLNHHVHGSGALKENLVPIRGPFNTQMESSIETYVKNRVLGNREVLYYKVTAVFGGHSGRVHLPEEALLPTALQFVLRPMVRKANTTGLAAGDWEIDPAVTSNLDNVPASRPHTLDPDSPVAVAATLDFAALRTEAATALAGTAPPTFSQFEHQDVLHERSVAALAPPNLADLRRLFDDHARQAEKNRLLADIAAMNNADAIVTWNMFQAGRTFFDTVDAAYTAVENAFNTRQRTLRSRALAAARDAIPGTPKSMLWRDFKIAQQINFLAEPSEARTFERLQTAFERHRDS